MRAALFYAPQGLFDSQVAAAIAAGLLSDYATLRLYSGNQTVVEITGDGVAGSFYYDSTDNVSGDNGGTVIVGVGGKRWKRKYIGDALPEWFGAKGGGNDDTGAVQAAMNTGRYKLTQVYGVSSKLNAPANSVGVGPGRLTKLANIDLVELGSAAKMIGIQMIGNGATKTGRGVIITGGTDQRLIDCDIMGMESYCVEHTAAQAGLRDTINGGLYYRQDTTQPAIKYPDLETNGDRRLLNVDCGGGILADLAGSATTMISGCDTTGLIFNANTKKAIVTGNRFAILGGTMTVYGIDSVVEGNCIAGNVVVGASAQNNTIGRNSYAGGYTVTDNSGNSTNFIDTLGVDVVPQWLASGTQPAIGNGSMTARVVRVGKLFRATIEIAFGTTTTFGSGTYTFKLSPEYDTFTVKSVGVGSAVALKSGVAFQVGNVTCEKPGLPAFSIYNHGGVNSWGATLPVTWANTDTIKFNIEFEIG